MKKYTFMALIQHIESAGSLEKSVGRATLNLGVDDDIGVGGLGGAEAEGTGLLEVDCLLIPKGWVGTVGVKDVGKGLGLMGWLLWSHSLGLLPNGLSQIFSFHLILSD